jgi:spermidine/putrescine transport system substrate-binding protein
MAIPAHAPHPKLANEFINFILKPKIGAKLSNWNSYASPNKAARPYLNKELQEPPIMPTAAQMKRLHFKPILKGKQLQLIQQLWTEVQSQ